MYETSGGAAGPAGGTAVTTTPLPPSFVTASPGGVVNDFGDGAVGGVGCGSIPTTARKTRITSPESSVLFVFKSFPVTSHDFRGSVPEINRIITEASPTSRRSLALLSPLIFRFVI